MLDSCFGSGDREGRGGIDRLGRILSPFLGFPVPPGEEEPRLPSWVGPSLPVLVSTGGILCELGLEACVFHFPPKGRSPGAQCRANEELSQSCRSS